MCGGNIHEAAELWCAQEDEPAEPSPMPTPVPRYRGPLTLAGIPAPESTMPSKTKGKGKAPPKKRGIATLGSLGNDDDDDGDQDDEDDGRGDLFAGGGKSGLAVQDPNQDASNPQKIIKDLMAKAAAR